jgi:hypothetical protein
MAALSIEIPFDIGLLPFDIGLLVLYTNGR